VIPAGAATVSSNALVTGRFYDDSLILADFFETGKTAARSTSSHVASTDTRPRPLHGRDLSRESNGLGEAATEKRQFPSQPVLVQGRLGYAVEGLHTRVELEVSNHG
jgi:hypothetical protein